MLAPLIQDLKTLEEDGVKVEFRNRSILFYGTVFQIISDNLAAHWLGGFQENFSTTKRICRTCKCLRTDMPNVFHNDDCEMRTPESFDRHVESGEMSDQFVKEYGVKNGCPLCLEVFPLHYWYAF